MTSSLPVLVVLHGVNFNLLEERDAQHYGSISLPELENLIKREAALHGWGCVCHQTNHEGTFVEYLHEYRKGDALLLNPGAWAHYSFAIRDALELVKAPVAEVHLSNIANREAWRRHSVLSDVVNVTIFGKGIEGYREAVGRLVSLVAQEKGEAAESAG